MIRYHAAWLLPMAQPPVPGGWIDVSDGRIVAVGQGTGGGGTGSSRDLGAVAILPGLVNAHTHLELSYLHERVPPTSEFVDWIRGVVALRRAQLDPRREEIVPAIHAGIEQAVRCGTAVVGDIGNTLATYQPLAAEGRLAGLIFHELLGFNAPEPDALVAETCRQMEALPAAPDLRVSLAAHAPYSVSPALFRAIRDAARRRGTPVSVHLSESAAESEFISRGTGPWRRFLEGVGAWDPAWQPAGTSPVQYLDALGVLDEQSIVVHGAHMTASDLATLKERGATLVTCPRSNRHTGAGTPPIADFYASGVRVAVGTDSLASTADLNVFAELSAMRAIAPLVPARRLLESATRHGAAALGFDADYGTIEPGKRDRLIGVAIPSDVADVEEYLVGGIAPEDISWIGA